MNHCALKTMNIEDRLHPAVMGGDDQAARECPLPEKAG